MGVLSRWFLARFFGSFAAILVVILGVIAIAELLLHVEDLVASDEGVVAASARYLALKIPAVYLRTVIPIAAFAAALVTFGTAARWHELTAAKASGISPLRLCVPVLLAAVLLAVLSFALNETVGLSALRGWDRRESDDDGDVVFRRGTFWYHRGYVIYNILSADRARRSLRGVNVYERDRSGRLRRSIRAPEVRIDPGRRWRFLDVTIRRFDPGDPLAPPAFEFREELVMEMSDALEGALRGVDPEHLSLPELIEYVTELGRGGASAARARAIFNQRLADPFLVLLFVALGVPLGVRVEAAKSFAIPALVGVAALALVLFSRNVGEVLVRENLAFSALAPWITLGAFGAVALLLLSRVPR